jgi:hypothetical protein
MRFLLFFVVSLTFGLLFGGESNYKYSYYPKRGVYQNQIFSITIFGKDAIKNSPTIILNNRENLDNSLEIISKRPLKKRAKGDVFYTFYFKAKNRNIILPSFIVQDDKNNTSILKSLQIPVKRLSVPKGIGFSGVIASDLKILNYKILSNKSIIVTLRANNANLEDFYLPSTIKRDLISIKRYGSIAEAKYLFYLGRDIVNSVDFSYYKSINSRFIPMTLSKVNKAEEELKKRVNLSPKDSSFMKFKKYTFGFLTIFFLLMFMIYKDYFYLGLFGITVIILLTFFAPIQRVCVQKGAKIYILPIENSTVGKIVTTKDEYPIYYKYKNFSKIEYEDGVAGWVKNEDLCEN